MSTSRTDGVTETLLISSDRPIPTMKRPDPAGGQRQQGSAKRRQRAILDNLELKESDYTSTQEKVRNGTLVAAGIDLGRKSIVTLVVPIRQRAGEYVDVTFTLSRDDFYEKSGVNALAKYTQSLNDKIPAELGLLAATPIGTASLGGILKHVTVFANVASRLFQVLYSVRWLIDVTVADVTADSQREQCSLWLLDRRNGPSSASRLFGAASGASPTFSRRSSARPRCTTRRYD